MADVPIVTPPIHLISFDIASLALRLELGLFMP